MKMIEIVQTSPNPLELAIATTATEAFALLKRINCQGQWAIENYLDAINPNNKFWPEDGRLETIRYRAKYMPSTLFDVDAFCFESALLLNVTELIGLLSDKDRTPEQVESFIEKIESGLI